MEALYAGLQGNIHVKRSQWIGSGCGLTIHDAWTGPVIRLGNSLRVIVGFSCCYVHGLERRVLNPLRFRKRFISRLRDTMSR